METYCNEETQYRVKLTSKTVVVEHLNKYKELLKKVINGQFQLSEETKQLLQEELLMNFETAVQENVLINDKTWEDAAEEEGKIGQQSTDYSVREEEQEALIEDEVIALDNLLDDHIVETAQKRRKFPKRIIPYVVRSLKTERKLMGMYKEVVKPQVLGKDPVQETIMTNISKAAPFHFKQASAVMKSVHAVQQRAEGLTQVLNTHPTAESMGVFGEVFGSRPKMENRTASRSRTTIKRAMEHTELRNIYGLGLKKPALSESKPE